MVQCRQTGHVGRVQRAPIVQQQFYHGHRADGCGAVERQLPVFVLDAGGRSVGDELTRGFEGVFGGAEV